MLWLIFALLAAVATSFTTIFAKIGIQNVKSNFATFYRTGIVIFCCVILCLITGSFANFNTLTKENWIFLILSGIATGCSWLCYYKALKLGDINKVAPIDKSSFVLTSILFVIFFFDDTTNGGNTLTISMLSLSIVLMLIGTILMIDKKESNGSTSKTWLIYAILSAVFASIVALFAKIGLKGIPSDLGTLIRSIIVFIFAGAIVLARKDYIGVKEINGHSWLFLTLSGIATGAAWLFEYYALNMEHTNPLAVNAIGKLAILLTMLFSFIVLKEKFSKKALLGLGLLTFGIILIIIYSL